MDARFVKFYLAVFFFLGHFAEAGTPNITTFQTRIKMPGGAALEASNVNFRFTILDAVGTCTLYVEDYPSVNMTGSQGIVSFNLGTGSKQFPAGSIGLHEVFNNSTPSFNCQAGGTYSPGLADRRQIVMQFNDGNGWQTLPQMAINSVFYSTYATRSEFLGAYPANDYLRAANFPTCTGSQALAFNGASFNCVAASSGGVSGLSATSPLLLSGSTSTPVLSLPSASATSSGYLSSADWTTFNNKANANLASGQLYIGNSSNAAMGVTLSGDATLTNSGILNLANSGVTAGTYGNVNAVPTIVIDTKGRVTSATSQAYQNATNVEKGIVQVGSNITVNSGLISLTSSDVSSALGFAPADSAAVNGAFVNGGNTTSADATFGLKSNFGLFFLTNNLSRIAITNSGNVGIGTNTPTYKLDVQGDLNISGNFKVNGVNIATGGGTVTSVSGTSPISVTSGSSTPVVSITQVSASANGYLSSSDWTSFNNKIGPSTVLSGDVSGTYNATSVDKIKGKIVSPVAYSVGQTFRYDGTTWVNSTLDFTDISSKPTTLSGYGITDAQSSTLNSGQILVGNSSNLSTAVTVSGDATLSNAGVLILKNTGTAGTYTKVTTDAQGRVILGATINSSDITTALGYTPLNKAGDSLNGAIGLNAIASDPTGLTTSDKGKVWYNTSSSQVKYWDGSTAVAVGISGSGLISLNGQTGSTQTFAVSTSGSDFTLSSSLNIHTLNLPTASSTNRGALSSADWTTFNNKLGTSTALSGDISGAYNTTSVDKIKGKSIVPVTYAAGQVLRYDGTNWVNNSLSMFDLRSTVTGSATFGAGCTSGQTLTWTAATDNLSCTNISLPVGQITGTLPLANGGTGATTQAAAANAILPTQTSNSGKYLTTDGTNVSWGAVTASPGGSSGQIQFNNSSALAGDSNLNWDNTNKRLGVGTSTPSDLISVFSSGGTANVKIVTGASSGTTAGIQLVGGSSSADWSIATNRADLFGAADSIGFYKNVGTSGAKMVITDSGRIGLGTTTPTTPIQINNSTPKIRMEDSSGSGTGGLSYTVSGTEKSYMQVLNQIATIGVGDSSWPTNNAFKVNTQGYYTGDYAFNMAGSTEVIKFRSFTGGSDYGAITVSTSGGGTMHLQSAAVTTQLFLSSNGNVGIGTTSPTATLDVKGHIANSGSAATVSSCGTSSLISGNDTKGYVTVGSGATTSCLITFNSAFATAPICTVTWRGSASTIGVGVTATTSALTINFSADAQSLSFNYHCLQ